MSSLEDFETKLNQVRMIWNFEGVSVNDVLSYNFGQAFEKNAMLENELDEKQRMGEMCQRLKDEVRGKH